MRSSFERFAAACAILAGAFGLLYAVSFVVLRNELLSGLFLLLGGLASTPVLVALYARLRETLPDEAPFAAWAVLLGTFALLGSAVHGGYDLANAIHPPAAVPGAGDLPSAIDPRGLLTFLVTGIAVLVLSWLIVRSGALPRGAGLLGYVLAALLVDLYVGRLLVLDAASPVIVVPALLAGFVAGPAWYLWLGVALWREAAGERQAARASAAVK